MKTVSDGKDSFILEENPSNRTVEVIPSNEPTLLEYKESPTQSGNNTVTEVIKSDEPKIVERIVV